MSKNFIGNVERAAVISADGCYRYRLSRSWLPSFGKALYRHRIAFCMLNPSTGDAFVDDATIRKCMTYAQRWGAGGLDIVNLFAWRSRDPLKLRDVPFPIGPENMQHLAEVFGDAEQVILAWGRLPFLRGHYSDHAETVTEMARIVRRRANKPPPMALHVNADGSPGHPLYLPFDRSPVAFCAP